MMDLLTHNAKETRAFAARLATQVQRGDLLLLHGDLGAGKTTFAQGLAEGLGIAAGVTSPTFTLVQEYRGGRLPLYHFDLYRLGGPDEVFDLGFFDYLEQGGVVVVEWPERLGESLPDERLDITLSAAGEAERTITLLARGARHTQLLTALEEQA
jgi:tRNA threonylcarbamoyladenosine biosynthesis protein TsaE